MASRKALVIIGGKIQQLPAGDYLDSPTSGSQDISVVNNNAGAIVIGTPVYIAAAGQVDKAKADAAATADVVGLVKTTSIAAAGTGIVTVDGVLTATTGQWDAVTGGSGGLTANTIYYLDPATAGKLTSTAPTTVGHSVTRVGKALSTTDLLINIEAPILL